MILIRKQLLWSSTDEATPCNFFTIFQSFEDFSSLALLQICIHKKILVDLRPKVNLRRYYYLFWS